MKTLASPLSHLTQNAQNYSGFQAHPVFDHICHTVQQKLHLHTFYEARESNKRSRSVQENEMCLII